MDHVGSKTGSLGHFIEKPCVRSRDHIFRPIIMNFGQKVSLAKILLKSRSLGQILEKSCVRCSGLIFSQIIMKPAQNVCLDKISDEFENGSCWVKN